MLSRLWNRFLHLSEPVVVVLIRICGWSSILFVFSIFLFIFEEGSPLLVNKLRYRFDETSIGEAAPRRTIGFSVPHPERQTEIISLLERSRAQIPGVAEIWLSADAEATAPVRIDLAEGADPQDATIEFLRRLQEFATGRDAPQELRLTRASDASLLSGAAILDVPYRKPESTAAILSRLRKEKKLSGIASIWSSISRVGEGRVRVELENGSTSRSLADEYAKAFSTRAIVLYELPFENPTDYTVERLQEAALEGDIRGTARIGMEAVRGEVLVVADLKPGARPEAVTRQILDAVPMRQDYSHIASFFASENWRPDSQTKPTFGILALLVGSLSVAFLAALLFVPLSLGAAIYVSEFCGGKVKEGLKILIELLAAIPSVVWGFIGYMIMNPIIIWATGQPIGLNVLNGGIILALMSIPIVVSLSEDALKAVPDGYREAALALGASRWQVVYKVLLPAAKSGLLAANLLGMGRAIGETMAMLMVTGHAINMPSSIFDPIRTMTATIAAELGEADKGGSHYQMLFCLGMLLMVAAMLINLTADVIVKGFRGKENA